MSNNNTNTDPVNSPKNSQPNRGGRHFRVANRHRRLCNQPTAPTAPSLGRDSLPSQTGTLRPVAEQCVMAERDVDHAQPWITERGERQRPAGFPKQHRPSSTFAC
jgi:hypothetical protein